MKTIILFARAPQRGRVKTRLAREIGDEAALGVYVAMLRDSLEKAARQALVVGGEAVLAYTPREAMDLPSQDGAPSLSELWSGASWPQPEGDLGARMHGAIRWALGRGTEAVALLGADTPDMELSELSAGFRLLERDELRASVDVALGPTRDGGFWTLMCARALPRQAFELDWSQDKTCARLQANLESVGLRASAGGRVGDDVDDLESLRRLSTRLRAGQSSAPHTALWMRENGWMQGNWSNSGRTST